MEFFQHLGHFAVALQPRDALDGELQILAQRHVRKQRVVLKNVAAVARLRRQVHARCAVEQDLVVKQDAAFVGAHESGDGIERQRFAGAARAEQHGESARRLEFDVEREAGRLGAFRILLANAAPGS